MLGLDSNTNSKHERGNLPLKDTGAYHVQILMHSCGMIQVTLLSHTITPAFSGQESELPRKRSRWWSQISTLITCDWPGAQ